jgi:hypothetical protein
MSWLIASSNSTSSLYLSIEVEPSFQDIAETADPAKISEQLRHANEQLELTRQHYPGRERAQPRSAQQSITWSL